MPAVDGVGALVLAGNVILAVGYVVWRTVYQTCRLALTVGGGVLLLGAGACHVVGLLGPVLRIGGEEAIALARSGGR